MLSHEKSPPSHVEKHTHSIALFTKTFFSLDSVPVEIISVTHTKKLKISGQCVC